MQEDKKEGVTLLDQLMKDIMTCHNTFLNGDDKTKMVNSYW